MNMNDNNEFNNNDFNNDNNFINQITIDYLINKGIYKTHLDKVKMKNTNKKDKKFYRKRILNLTKEFLLFNEKEDILPDVKNAFENYVKTCVEYFKILDKTDIIQEDYCDLEENEKEKEINKLLDYDEVNVENSHINNSSSFNDNLLMRSIHIKHPLDKFIKRNKFKKEQEVLPIQKEINLQEPYLKNKGICKKKNINNNYDKVTNTETQKT